MKNSTLLLVLGVLFLLSRPAGGGVAAKRPWLNSSTGKPILTPGTKQLSDEELRALIRKVGFPDVEGALAIIKRESGGFVDVVVNTAGMSPEDIHAYWRKPSGVRLDPKGETAVGLWQINVLANPQFALEDMKDPEKNMRAAFTLSKSGTDMSAWRQAS